MWWWQHHAAFLHALEEQQRSRAHLGESVNRRAGEG